MPKFVKFSFVLTILLWGFWLFLLFLGISPSTYQEIFLFLGVLFFCLGFSFSFPFYFVYLKKYPKFTDLRMLFKRALKWGFFISFGVVVFSFLLAFHLVTALNLFLVGVFLIAMFFQLKGRR